MQCSDSTKSTQGSRRRSRPIAALLAGALLSSSLPAGVQPQDARSAAVSRDEASAAQEAAATVVARGGALAVTRGEIIPILLDRFGMAASGRDLLKLLISTKVLDQIGREEGLEISSEEVTRRWREIDQQVRASGGEGGIETEITQRGISPEEFREYLRLQLLQEELTRRALDLEKGTPVSPDSQEVWLAQTLVDRGLDNLPPPWTDGIVARCKGVTITTEELGSELLSKLDDVDVRETAWHMLLLEGLEKRMPDLSAEARTTALRSEMERRRQKAESAAAAQQGIGVTFEDILRARGTSYDALARDPSVAIAALTRLWVDRTQGEDGLRKTYESERDYFDGRWGVALKTHAIFLIAGEFKNDLVKRTFDEADAELEKLKADVRDLDAFRAYASKYSEDPSSRSSGGDLGWVARQDPTYPEDLRLPLFRFYDALPADAKTVPSEGALVGPVHFEAGSALIHVAEIRPQPSWDELKVEVHEELRRRLIEELMPLDKVEIVVR